ncbi:hypothetical protein [Roseobacter sinensis]|uniref:Uncharacterized protein n=1 Tax=Roseobacter sinensis TaxID=2931391 RepID=A0ABT3BC37_9RHOB|nr:hypothetical protein [Roseobacter sp. WL0113]MCV3270734.1 hypothetical protein [Roseobacter sp. WL0113]
MLEKNSDHSGDPQGAQGEKPTVKDLYAVPNWEERLTAARAQRERALARHLQAKTTRTSEVEAIVAPPPDTAEDAEANGISGTADEHTVAAPESDVRRGVLMRPGRTILVAMACFASLGFGLALGLGTLLGIGALRPPPPIIETATPQPDPPAPDERVAMDVEPAPVVTPAPPDPAPVPATPPVTQVALPAAVDPPPPAKTPPLAKAQPLFADVQAQPNSPAEEPLSLVAWLPLQAFAAAETPADPPALPVTPPDPLPGAEWTLADKLAAGGTDLSVLDLRVYAPDAVPEGRLNASLAQLDDTGLSVANLQRVDFAVSTAHIRFYNAEDAAAAGALGKSLGIEARDFSAEQRGPLGLIEVWFAGVPKSALAEEIAGRRSGTYLFDRLRDKLRSD